MITQNARIADVDSPAVVKMFNFGVADEVINVLAKKLKKEVDWAQRVLVHASRNTFNLAVGGKLLPAQPIRYRCHFKRNALQTAEVLVMFAHQGATWYTILQIDSVTRWTCKKDGNGLATIYSEDPWDQTP